MSQLGPLSLADTTRMTAHTKNKTVGGTVDKALVFHISQIHFISMVQFT